MENLFWILWCILGAVLIVAEVFTSGFVLLWFGIGALARCAGRHRRHQQPGHSVSDFRGSLCRTHCRFAHDLRQLFFTREVGRLAAHRRRRSAGKIGTVVSSSRGAMQEGAVKVFGSTWTAYPAQGESALEAGERVRVESIEGSSIYVRRIDEGTDWRAKELPNGGIAAAVDCEVFSRFSKCSLSLTGGRDFPFVI